MKKTFDAIISKTMEYKTMSYYRSKIPPYLKHRREPDAMVLTNPSLRPRSYEIAINTKIHLSNTLFDFKHNLNQV